jgi:hypothetical protein
MYWTPAEIFCKYLIKYCNKQYIKYISVFRFIYKIYVLKHVC